MQIILGIVFLIVLAFVISKLEILSPRAKTLIFTLLMTTLATAILYEFMVSKTQQQNRQLINAFSQGKTLICKDQQITTDNFTIERGTSSFMAKQGKTDIAGIIYAIEDCKLSK
jgi:predicted PurR-regulated permease PerM